MDHPEGCIEVLNNFREQYNYLFKVSHINQNLIHNIRQLEINHKDGIDITLHFELRAVFMLKDVFLSELGNAILEDNY